jgi:hypothetical protein
VNPGDQTNDVGDVVSLQLTSTGGAAPVTWSAVGLPTGVTVTSGGLVSGTTTTVGTYQVVASVTDAFGLTGTAAFTWTVNDLPTQTNPGDQNTTHGNAVNVHVGCSGGTGSYKWTASNLPPGLSIDGTTGVISGTPTTADTGRSVTVRTTDQRGRTTSSTFTWNVS